jgi:transcriptional regulator of acetoin/glycerol metabolism
VAGGEGHHQARTEICEGNILRAAAHLGISASTIYRKRMAWQAEGRA